MDKFKKEKIEIIIDQYYRLIGLERDDKTRHREHVQARAAMLTALKKHMPFSAAGKFFGKDHSSVIYHYYNHDANMEYWPGYASRFKDAERLVRLGLEMKDTQARIRVIDREISKLQTAKESLLEIIKDYEQLQIQNH